MIKISRKVEYSLMVLKYLHDYADRTNLISAREICDRFQIPFDTTAKVMQQLCTEGILKSVQGVKGGYFIEKSLHEITYSQLVECVEGRTLSFDCSSVSCSLIEKCNITTPIKKLNSMLVNFVAHITLGQLLETQEKIIVEAVINE